MTLTSRFAAVASAVAQAPELRSRSPPPLVETGKKAGAASPALARGRARASSRGRACARRRRWRWRRSSCHGSCRAGRLERVRQRARTRRTTLTPRRATRTSLKTRSNRDPSRG
eukprot:934863-Pleurochrysis_carterae.AAC.2